MTLRKSQSIILVFFTLFFLFLSESYVPAAGLKSIEVSRNNAPEFIGYVPNEIVVKFSDQTVKELDKDAMLRGKTGNSRLDQINSKHKAASIKRQFTGAKSKTIKGKRFDLSGWHKISFDKNVDIDAVVGEYKADPAIIDAQPIGIHALYGTPNDGSFGSQWHLHQSSDKDIDGPEAWDGQTGDEDIIVAVLDTGVRYYHKDLGGDGASYNNKTNIDGNMWINSIEKNGISGSDDDANGYTDDWIGWDFVNGATPCWSGEDCNTQDNNPEDFNGHGTHCAGNIAAITNNGYAAAGVAGGWGNGTIQSSSDGVKTMALRIGWSGSYNSSEVGYVRMDFAAEALQYAADNGAKIASCSWSSSNTGGIGAAIDYFTANDGIIFKAAGNDSDTDADYMCARGDIICVAATDHEDCKADFSNYGSWVDISAPGVGILSLYHSHSVPSSDYLTTMSGTSMATPLAAGTAALIWSSIPTWSKDLVKEQLLSSADSIDDLECNSGYSGRLGSGRINAYKAVFVDSDNDGITDWEEGEYGTDPDIADTDSDGINDGDELAYWGDDWSADADSDGVCNLIDYDSDNDGFSDGIEIEGGFDPSDAESHPKAVPVMTWFGGLLALILLAILGAMNLKKVRA